MADLLGEFSFRHVGNSYSKAADGSVMNSSNWEGTATGYGTVFGTVMVPLKDGNTVSGSCTWLGQGFPEGKPFVTGSGDGTWQEVKGQHRWKLTFPLIEGTDGSRLRCEGEIDLAARTFTGKMFDAS